MKKAKVKCRDYEGELISIKPDETTVYPDGDKKIITYKVKLVTVVGDIVIVRNVFAEDIEIYAEY